MDCNHLSLNTNCGKLESPEFSEAYHEVICRDDYTNCSEILVRYLGSLHGKGFSPDDILKFAVRHLFMLTSGNSASGASHIIQIEFYHKFMTSVTPYEVETRIRNYVRNFLNNGRNMIYSKPVETVIREIERSYNKPISLNSIADQLKITP